MLMEVDFWPVNWNVLSLSVFLILIFLVIRRVFCIIVLYKYVLVKGIAFQPEATAMLSC